MGGLSTNGRLFSLGAIAGMLLLLLPTAGWAKQKPLVPESVSGVKIISHDELKSMISSKKVGVDFHIFDSRKSSDYEAGRISGAVHMPVPGKPDLGDAEVQKAIDKMKGKLPSNKKILIVFYCNGHRCWRSPKAAKAAVKMGYENVGWLRDGFPEWQKQGYPVE